MIKGKAVIAVIVARGGSKGLPGKNLLPLGGLPMIAHTIRAAKKVKLLDRVILSTDSPKIARVGQRYGAEIPFLRPKHLAQDKTHTPPVIAHAVNFIEKKELVKFDLVVTLQPTSPFRRPEHISEAVELLAANAQWDSVISVKETSFPPYWMLTARGKLLSPLLKSKIDFSLKERQELKKTYQPNGAVYVTRRDVLKNKRKIYTAFAKGKTGFIVMDHLSSLDIDGPIEYQLTKLALKEHPELLKD